MATACPLCGLRFRGGDLCPGCLADLIPGEPGAGRCTRCAMTLDAGLSQHAPLISARGLRAGGLCDGCASTHAPARSVARTLAVIDYAYPGDMLITALKERGRIEVAALLGRLIAQAICSPLAGLPPLGAIVPVPAASASLRRRGFNPAGEIARAVASGTGVPLQRGWLACVRTTASQKTLGRRARWRAPVGSFEALPVLPGVWVGLVDDVMTTGSTLHHAALALRSAGVAGVVGLVAARTPAPLWHNIGHVRRDPGSA